MLREAPNVELVDGEDTGDSFQVVFNVLELDAERNALQEDRARVLDCRIAVLVYFLVWGWNGRGNEKGTWVPRGKALSRIIKLIAMLTAGSA